MLGLTIAAALLHAPNPCYVPGAPAGLPGCPVWRRIDANDDGTLFADPATLRRSGSRFELTVRIVFAQDDGGGFESVVAHYRYDCAARTSTLLSVTGYDARGNTVPDPEAGKGEEPPDPAPDDSPGGAMLRAYCQP